jgi:hypothetical protein
MSAREADECSRISGDGQVERWSSESEGDTLPIKDTILPKQVVKEAGTHKDVGQKIARDFGEKGVFTGEVVAVEHDSEDIDKIEAIFVVEYTDGDREDMDSDELKYACELYVECSGANDYTPEGSLNSESGEEESYVPSPKVCVSTYFYHTIMTYEFSFPFAIEKKKEEVDQCEG